MSKNSRKNKDNSQTARSVGGRGSNGKLVIRKGSGKSGRGSSLGLPGQVRSESKYLSIPTANVANFSYNSQCVITD